MPQISKAQIEKIIQVLRGAVDLQYEGGEDSIAVLQRLLQQGEAQPVAYMRCVTRGHAPNDYWDDIEK